MSSNVGLLLLLMLILIGLRWMCILFQGSCCRVMNLMMLWCRIVQLTRRCVGFQRLRALIIRNVWCHRTLLKLLSLLRCIIWILEIKANFRWIVSLRKPILNRSTIVAVQFAVSFLASLFFRYTCLLLPGCASTRIITSVTWQSRVRPRYNIWILVSSALILVISKVVWCVGAFCSPRNSSATLPIPSRLNLCVT